MKTNLNTLKYVVAVDTYRNFVKAAQACGVTQPTLSTAIGNMEMELDVTIFDRNSHPVKPTAIGEKIIAMAKATLHDAAQIEEIVRSERGQEEGEVSIGLIPTVAPYILPDLFADITATHPGIHMKAYEMRTGSMISRLLNSEIDMAILSTPTGQRGILEIPLYYERFVAYVSPSDPLHDLEEIPASQLPSDRLWILEEGHCLCSQVFSFCHNRRRTHTEYQAGSIDNLIRIVDRNGGYTVIPEMHVPLLDSGQRRNVRPIVGETRDKKDPQCSSCVPVREISIAIREGYLREGLLNIIAGCIKKIVPENMLDARLRKFAIRI